MTSEQGPGCRECAQQTRRSDAIWRGIGIIIGGASMAAFLLWLMLAAAQDTGTEA